MAHFFHINDFTTFIHEWLTNFGTNSIEDNLYYKIVFKLISFELDINMNINNRKQRHPQLLHIANDVYNKTFFNVSSLDEHVFFKLFTFHSQILHHRSEHTQSSFPQSSPLIEENVPKRINAAN